MDIYSASVYDSEVFIFGLYYSRISLLIWPNSKICKQPQVFDKKADFSSDVYHKVASVVQFTYMMIRRKHCIFHIPKQIVKAYLSDFCTQSLVLLWGSGLH